jgi:hypothetical protein
MPRYAVSFCARFSRFFWTGQPLSYPTVQKSGAAALAGDSAAKIAASLRSID